MVEVAYLYIASYLRCWHFVPPLVACEGGHPPSILPKGGAAVNKSRPKKVTFRLSEEEHRQLQERISNSGLSSQEYILRAVLHTTVQSNTELKEMLPELKKVSTELSRQGNNLNQIATVLNQRGYVDYKNTLPQTLEAVRHATEEVKELWQSLRQYLQKHR